MFTLVMCYYLTAASTTIECVTTPNRFPNLHECDVVRMSIVWVGEATTTRCYRELDS